MRNLPELPSEVSHDDPVAMPLPQVSAAELTPSALP